MKPIKSGVGPPQWQRILLYAVLAFVVLSLFFPFQDKERVDIPYTEFKREVQEGNVTEVTVRGSRIRGKFKNALTENLKRPEEGADVATYTNFRTVKPSFEDPDALRLLEENGVTIYAEAEEESWWSTLAIGLLPWLLILGLIFYSARS